MLANAKLAMCCLANLEKVLTVLSVFSGALAQNN